MTWIILSAHPQHTHLSHSTPWHCWTLSARLTNREHTHMQNIHVDKILCSCTVRNTPIFTISSVSGYTHDSTLTMLSEHRKRARYEVALSHTKFQTKVVCYSFLVHHNRSGVFSKQRINFHIFRYKQNTSARAHAHSIPKCECNWVRGDENSSPHYGLFVHCTF